MPFTVTLCKVVPSVTVIVPVFGYATSGSGSWSARVIVIVLPDTAAVTRGWVEFAEYTPVPPTADTETLRPQMSPKLTVVGETAIAGGAPVPSALLTVTVARREGLAESVTTIVALVTHTDGLVTWTVKRPGSVLLVAGITPTFGSELNAL